MDVKITKDTPKEEIEKLGSECKQCGHCCRYSSGFLLEEDLPKIAKHLEITEEELKQSYLEEISMFNTKRHRPRLLRKSKPYGICVFFNDAEGCTIHGIKPFHCKIGTCNEHGEKISEWFMLNYFVRSDDPESIREWAAHIRAGKTTIPGGNLHELVPDRKKLAKILNREEKNNENKKS